VILFFVQILKSSGENCKVFAGSIGDSLRGSKENFLHEKLYVTIPFLLHMYPLVSFIAMAFSQ